MLHQLLNRHPHVQHGGCHPRKVGIRGDAIAHREGRFPARLFPCASSCGLFGGRVAVGRLCKGVGRTGRRAFSLTRGSFGVSSGRKRPSPRPSGRGFFVFTTPKLRQRSAEPAITRLSIPASGTNSHAGASPRIFECRRAQRLRAVRAGIKAIETISLFSRSPIVTAGQSLREFVIPDFSHRQRGAVDPTKASRSTS